MIRIRYTRCTMLGRCNRWTQKSSERTPFIPFGSSEKCNSLASKPSSKVIFVKKMFALISTSPPFTLNFLFFFVAAILTSLGFGYLSQGKTLKQRLRSRIYLIIKLKPESWWCTVHKELQQKIIKPRKEMLVSLANVEKVVTCE